MLGDVPRRGLSAPPQPPRLLQTGERPALPAGTDEVVAQIIDQAHDRLQAVLDLSGEIPKESVRAKVEQLCRTGEHIVAELGREPRQVELARAFLTYYLEAAQRIVKRYVELGRRESPADEVRDTLDRAEVSLESIQRAFDQQLAALLQSDVIDLDSEIELLEKTVQMDGMGKMRPVGRHTREQG
jgi:5-bromo-4-chloroindolyl phosphate hydrolysis protein